MEDFDIQQLYIVNQLYWQQCILRLLYYNVHVCCASQQISCFKGALSGRYLRYAFDTLFLQQLLIKPLGLIRGHVGLISGEEANLVCVRPLSMWQRAETLSEVVSDEKVIEALAAVCSVL